MGSVAFCLVSGEVGNSASSVSYGVSWHRISQTVAFRTWRSFTPERMSPPAMPSSHLCMAAFQSKKPSSEVLLSLQPAIKRRVIQSRGTAGFAPCVAQGEGVLQLFMDLAFALGFHKRTGSIRRETELVKGCLLGDGCILRLRMAGRNTVESAKIDAEVRGRDERCKLRLTKGGFLSHSKGHEHAKSHALGRVRHNGFTASPFAPAPDTEASRTTTAEASGHACWVGGRIVGERTSPAGPAKGVG